MRPLLAVLLVAFVLQAADTPAAPKPAEAAAPAPEAMTKLETLALSAIQERAQQLQADIGEFNAAVCRGHNVPLEKCAVDGNQRTVGLRPPPPAPAPPAKAEPPKK